MRILRNNYKRTLTILTFAVSGLLISLPAQADGKITQAQRSHFYDVYSGSSLEGIDKELVELEKQSSSSITRAFSGALLMKKAGLLKHKREQLEVFKKGRLLLEAEISQEPKNPEYAFLRLTIQEKAPRILGYNKNIANDKKLVIENFEKMNKELKQAIIDYSKTSEVLNLKKTDN